LTEHEGSTLVSKGSCDDCGSSDACATYSDGHTHCFSCKKTHPGDGDYVPSADTTNRAEDLIENGRFQELLKRGIREETCRRALYRVADYGGRKVQVAEYCDAVGNVVAQKVRTPDKDFFVLGDLKQAGLYCQHLWRSGGNKIVVTEGEIDCLTVMQAQSLKWPVVSISGGAASAAKNLKAQLEWLNSYKEIILWFDNDGPGIEATKECAKLFPPGKVKIVTTPNDCKDANELLQKHGGPSVLQAVWDAREYRPDGVISGSDLSVERLKAKASPGWQTPYPLVNEKTRGIRPRQLWLLTAGTGVGKSTDAREWLYAALCEGKRVGAVFLEESVEDTGRYLVALDNNVLAEDLEDNPEILSAAKWDASHAKLFGGGNYQAYDHFGATDSNDLLNKLEYMAAAGAELIFLDHLTIAATGLDLEGVDNLMVKLRSMIERTGCSVIAIAHIRKTPNGAKAAEEGGDISLDDIKGSGSLKQVPDVIIAKKRNQQDDDARARNRSQLKVLKVRRGGKTGPADVLLYDEKTGRLKPVDSEDFPDTSDDDCPF
jgi:twinkle protein